MGQNFMPSQNSYKDLGQFRFWCQKVLPLVYDDSLSYYELLCKVVNYLNETIQNVDLMGDDMQKLYNAYGLLQEYADNYFDTLDVHVEINEKLDTMAKDGTLGVLIEGLFDGYKDEVNDVIAYQNADITALQRRMDTFTSLGAGSTTGDAEVIDIRVGADGTTYGNAGTAVRQQMMARNVTSEILEEIESITLTPVTEVLEVIEEKAMEVLETIPEEFVEVSMKVAEVENTVVELDNKVGCFSNTNLLINSDFRNPVNQRGQTSYTSQNNWTKYYSIDRWNMTKLTSVTVNEGSITVTNNNSSETSYFGQGLEKTYELDLTLSVMVKSVTGVVNVWGSPLQVGLNVVHAGEPMNNVTFILNRGASVEIEYVKLERGSVATPFIPRHYVEELALCKYYHDEGTLSVPQNFEHQDGGYYVYTVEIPIPNMRTKPTVTAKFSYMNTDGMSTTATDISSSDIAVYSKVMKLKTRSTTIKSTNSHTITIDYVFDSEMY